MSNKTSWLLVFFAFCVAITCLLGDESFAGLARLRTALDQQRQHNAELQEHVMGLRREVRLLDDDPRTIEKAARNQLGLARSDELVFVFK